MGPELIPSARVRVGNIPVGMTSAGFFGTRALVALLLLSASLPPLRAQQPTGVNDQAVVTFTLDFPASDPSHYSISVRQDSHGTYQSSAKASEDSEDQLYRSEFQVSAAIREKIFTLTRQADFFAGKLDSGNHKLAFTGTKTISYQDGQRSH